METKSYVCDMYTIVNLLKKVESIVKDYKLMYKNSNKSK